MIQKSYKQYDYICRYETFPYFYDAKNNRYYYGLTANLRTDVGYVLHKVKAGDSYDSLSLDYYGSPIFYWVIIDFNRIRDAFSSPEVGSEIKIPSLNTIQYQR